MEPAKIQLNHISNDLNPHAIKNFLVSNSSLPQEGYLLSTDYPFVLDSIAIAICTNGSARLKINFKEYDVEKNTVITTMPHFVTEFRSKSDDFTIEFCIFSIDFLMDAPSPSNFDIAKRIVTNPCIKVDEDRAKILLDFHSFILKQYQRIDHPFRGEMAKGLLSALLTEIGAIYYLDKSDEPGKSIYKEELIYRFFRLVLNNHRTERSLDFYADKMCLTTKYLSTVIKQTTGRTAMHWINETIIASAKYLLKTTDMTIAQISDELSFPNPSFFGSYFKKHTGCTPVDFRNN